MLQSSGTKQTCQLQGDAGDGYRHEAGTCQEDSDPEEVLGQTQQHSPGQRRHKGLKSGGGEGPHGLERWYLKPDVILGN